MTNQDKLKRCFKEALVLPSGTEIEGLIYQDHPSWDSVGHMKLIGEIEHEFGVTLTTDQILDIYDYPAAQHILSSHGISFES